MGINAQPARTGYLPTLDGWRAIAIALVLFHHFVEGVSAGSGFWFVSVGGHGVAIFFGISGFLITSRLLEEHTLLGRVSLRDFYVRRAFRILPPALTYLGVIALLAFAVDLPVSRLGWFSALTFWRDYAQTGDWYTGHYWSLSVEEKFYLLWPPALVALGTRRGLVVGAVVAILAGIWRVIDSHFGVLVPIGLAPGSVHFRWDTRLDALLYGCLLALLLNDSGWRRRIASWLTPLAQVLLALTLVLVMAGFVYRPTILFALEAVVVPLLLASTVLHPQRGVSLILESPIARWIGRLSYSLYLWQQLIFSQGSQDLGVAQSTFVAPCLVVLFAWTSYRFIERPSIRYGHRLARPATPGRLDAMTTEVV